MQCTRPSDGPSIHIIDWDGLWSVIQSPFRSRLPLAKWKVKGRVGASITVNPVNLHLQMSYSSLPFADTRRTLARMELPYNWHNIPYTNILLLKCESAEIYTSTHRSLVKRLTEYFRLSDKELREPRLAGDFFVVYIPVGAALRDRTDDSKHLPANKKAYEKVYDRLKSDVNGACIKMDLIEAADQSWAELFEKVLIPQRHANRIHAQFRNPYPPSPLSFPFTTPTPIRSYFLAFCKFGR